MQTLTAPLPAYGNRYADEANKLDTLDGVSMEFDRWRFNLRKSNTEFVVLPEPETRGKATRAHAGEDGRVARADPRLTRAAKHPAAVPQGAQHDIHLGDQGRSSADQAAALGLAAPR